MTLCNPHLSAIDPLPKVYSSFSQGRTMGVITSNKYGRGWKTHEDLENYIAELERRKLPASWTAVSRNSGRVWWVLCWIHWAIKVHGKPTPSFRGIWWVPCGYFSFLPIHAAGDHEKDSVQNTLDCVISSYSPTFRLLKHAPMKYRPGISEVLFVATPETPGKAPFPKLEKKSRLSCQ